MDGVTKAETDQLGIIHTMDNQFALGVISTPRPATASGVPGLRYAYFNFNIHPFDQSTFKWSVVVREDLKHGDSFDVTSYLCVGSLDMVVECLSNVQKNTYDACI